MNKRRLIIPAALGLLAAAAFLYGILHPTITVRLTQDQVQQRVDAKMPIAGVRMGVAYEVSQARVDLRPDGRIGITSDVSASALNRTADVTLTGSGLVAYEDGAFFLTGFKVEAVAPRSVDAPLVEDEAGPAKGRIASAIGALGMRDRAARALEAAGVKDGAAFLTARKDAVVAMARDKGGEMLAGALDRHPVYRLRDGDVRQSLARLALQDVRVEDGTLVIELNVMRAFFRFALYAIGTVFALLAGLAFVVGMSSGGAGAGLLGVGIGLLD